MGVLRAGEVLDGNPNDLIVAVNNENGREEAMMDTTSGSVNSEDKWEPKCVGSGDE